MVSRWHVQSKMKKCVTPSVACILPVSVCLYGGCDYLAYLDDTYFPFDADSQPSPPKLTIDKEFEQYFSMLML